MKANFQNFDIDKSIDRIDEILDASNNEFSDVKAIPSRDTLTYANGYYVNCSALFIDIRDSSKLPDKHTKPVLAKIYRAYISEMVAVLSGNVDCKEINIHGDSVWGVFDTPYKRDIDYLFGTACKISSVVNILNEKLDKKGFESIIVGVGLDYGKALMIKSGYSGSGMNDVVWMGKVVNRASKLCGYGNKTIYDNETMVSEVFYDNLNDHNKSLLTYNSNRVCYHGNIIWTSYEEK